MLYILNVIPHFRAVTASPNPDRGFGLLVSLDTNYAECFITPKQERCRPVSYTHLDVYKRQSVKLICPLICYCNSRVAPNCLN